MRAYSDINTYLMFTILFMSVPINYGNYGEWMLNFLVAIFSILSLFCFSLY